MSRMKGVTLKLEFHMQHRGHPIHDGFTMNDVVSYNGTYNTVNGEGEHRRPWQVKT